MTHNQRRNVLRGSTGLVVSAVLLLIALVAPASAAPALTSLSTVLSISGNGQSDTLIVYAELASATRLPASVSVPVPSGGSISWVGEILGGDPSQDPTAEYKVAKERGYDLVTITAKQVPRVQVEMSVPARSNAPAQDYVVSQPILGPTTTASVSFQLPSGSSISKASPGLVKDGSSNGVDRYTLTASKPKPGTTLDASISARIVASPQAGSSQEPVGQRPPAAPQQQGQQPVAGATRATGSPWMTLAVVASIIFFLYNFQKYRQVKAVERAGSNGSQPRIEGKTARQQQSKGHAKAGQKAGHTPTKAPHPSAAEPEVALELKTLGDRRSRGELSREEYLARKKQLLAG